MTVAERGADLTPAERAEAQPFDKELREAGQLTSPTWELELFLSGALVFAMLQLPGVVNQFFAGIEPHVAGASRTVVINLALYAKAIAYTLLLTFSIHLIGRAQWVALMGLQSVYPGGIRWDEMKVGPLAREIYQKRTPAMSRSIATLDNFCSIVFSVGMLFVVLFIFSATMVGVLAGVAWLMAKLVTHGQRTDLWFLGAAAVFVAVPVTASLADRKWGARLAPASWGHRVLTAMLRFSVAINLVRIAGPMMWTLMSNVGRKKAVAALYVGLMVIVMIATADQLMRQGALSVNGYEYYGASLAHGISGGQYENQRPANTPPRTPMIQSDIVRDPYVKLFIPYSPDRHNATIARQCPGIKPLQKQGVQLGVDAPVADSLAIPALACLAKIHAITLDGVPRPDLEFSFYEHPATGLRGILAYIAIDSLASGRHVITVMPAQPAALPTDSAALAKAAWKKPYVIPFWK